MIHHVHKPCVFMIVKPTGRQRLFIIRSILHHVQIGTIAQMISGVHDYCYHLRYGLTTDMLPSAKQRLHVISTVHM